jgi:hypothetical protein
MQNDIGGKIKLVGNSVKSKRMSVYIEDFLGKFHSYVIRMAMDIPLLITIMSMLIRFIIIKYH